MLIYSFAPMVERASPGPYLELFARRAAPGWTCWGKEVETVETAGQVEEAAGGKEMPTPRRKGK